MKKLFISSLIIMLTSCSMNTQRLENKEQLVGEWSCQTKYDALRVGSIDLISLKADGTMTDDNHIFDNSLDLLLDRETRDYFSSPFKYLRISAGKWRLDNQKLVYRLKTQDVRRTIFPDVFENIQKSERLKQREKVIFDIYSESSDEPIELDFSHFTRDGFVVHQKMGESIYKSECTRKEKAEFNFNQRLELYKIISQKSRLPK